MEPEQQGIDNLKRKLKEAWETVSPNWNDEYKKDFEKNSISEMQEIINKIEKLILKSIDEKNIVKKKLIELQKTIQQQMESEKF